MDGERSVNLSSLAIECASSWSTDVMEFRKNEEFFPTDLFQRPIGDLAHSIRQKPSRYPTVQLAKGRIARVEERGEVETEVLRGGT